MNEEIIKYVEYLFSIALKKCSNIDDAQDLTQETLLEAIKYTEHGKISNMKYWLSSTLSHKWNDMLRKKYKMPIISIDTLPEIIDENDDTYSEKPTYRQVRREVAYLAKLQREVVVRHYLQGQKVNDIAKSLGVPKGTVLSRLSSGREQMKKGFETMKQYEKQSYTPEKLEIGCNGRPGFNNEPFSLVENNLMKQNILIIAYKKPLTVVEIARALGIPTPYIENAVDELVASELMCRQGNKIFTDFTIVTTDDLLKHLEYQIAFAKEHYSEIWACFCELFSDLRKLEWYKKFSTKECTIFEYYCMLEVFSCGIHMAKKRILDTDIEFPPRPNGGEWIAQGTIYPQDFDFENDLFGKYCYCGARRIYFENFLSAKSVNLHIYDTQPDLNKYQHGPIEIDDDNLCKLLYIIKQGIPFDMVAFNSMFTEAIPHLAECGILEYENSRPKVAIPILTKNEYEEMFKTVTKYTTKLADVLEGPIKENLPKFRVDYPTHLVGRVPEINQYQIYCMPMAVVKNAIEKGDFLQGVAYKTPPMILVIDK